MTETEAYELLGLNDDCSREDVENALRSKSKEFHPDRNPDKEDWATQQQKKINTAYYLVKSARERQKSNERTKPCEGQKQSSPPEQRTREQRTREQRTREQRTREQRTREQRAREQRTREQRTREQRTREQRAREQRAREQRAREQRAGEQRAGEQRAREQRAIEKRAAQIHEARKNGTLDELLRSWDEYLPDEKTQYEDGSQCKEWAQYHDDIPSPKRQNSTCGWQSGDSKQTQPKNSPISQKSYWPKNGQSKETSGLQRFGEFIRFLIDEIIFLCLGR